MYDRDKTIKIVHDVVDEVKDVKPYVVVAQPRRDLKETPAQRLDGYEGLHIDFLGYSHGYCCIGGEKVDGARIWLIEEVISSGAKYMFFVGEDTVVPWDGFIKLHEIAEKNPDAMVAGVYYIKISSPMVMVKDEKYIYPANVDPGRVFEAFLAGLDAILIRVSILEKMKENEPDVPFTCIGNLEGLPFVGEDNFFFHRARKNGFRLLINTDVQCLHMDLATGKYTAHPDVDLDYYYTNIPITKRLTMKDKKYIDQRWIDRIPEGSHSKEE